MATENYSDIICSNLETNNLISDHQKFYFTKNIITINENNSNYTITNSNSNYIFVINYENDSDNLETRIINIILPNDLKTGFNIEFYFKSSIYEFNIINNNLYNFTGSYMWINSDIIGKSILKTNSNITNNFNIKYDSNSFININNSHLNFLLNNNTFIIKGVINNKILYKVKYDNVNNNILINNKIIPELNFNQSYSYEFDISDESMKNINFDFFKTNDDIFNKNTIRIGEEGYFNSKYIIDVPINLLNFNNNYPIKLKYGFKKEKIILDTDYVIGNWDSIEQNKYENIEQKYLNQIDKDNSNPLKWKILNNNEINFNFNNKSNLITYFKFYYIYDGKKVDNNNKINNIILYGSNYSNYSKLYEIYNETFTLVDVSNQDYLEKSFINKKTYLYYKFVLNAFTSYSISIYCFEVGTDYSSTTKGVININSKHSETNYFNNNNYIPNINNYITNNNVLNNNNLLNNNNNYISNNEISQTNNFLVTVQNGKYYLNNIESPVLYLNSNSIYTFNLNDPSTSGHPFYITKSIIGGEPAILYKYNFNIKNNGSNFNTQQKIVELDTNNFNNQEIYYQCGIHSYMGNKINIINNNTTTSNNNTTTSNNNTTTSNNNTTTSNNNTTTSNNYY